MTKQQALEHWLERFTRQMAMRGVHDLSIIEVEIFKGAFELGWDAYDAQLLKPSGGIELDEFGRTDAQLELEIREAINDRI